MKRLSLLMPVFMAMLVTLCIISTAVITKSAATLAQSFVNSNWRGSYDILIVPHTTNRSFTVDGLVEPNYLGTTNNQHITPAQLTAVQKLPNVDVAAPVGMLGLTPSNRNAIVISLPENLASAGQIRQASYQLYAVDAAGRRHNLASDLTLSAYYKNANVNDPVLGVGICVRPDDPKNLCGIGLTASNPNFLLPSLWGPFVAVDPKAEQKLLGDEGKFLAPLEPYQTFPSFLKEDDGYPQYPVLLANTFPSQGSKIFADVELKISDQPLSDLDLPEIKQCINTHNDRVDICYELMKNKVIANAKTTSWHSAFKKQAEVTSRLSPSQNDDTLKVKDNVNRSELIISVLPNIDVIETVSRPNYQLQSKGVLVRSQGLQNAVYFSANSAGTVHAKIAQEQSYRQSKSVSINKITIKPVGNYDLDQLPKDNGQVAYAPLGVYKNALPLDQDGRLIAPIYNGLDFTTPPPSHITTIAVAEKLLGYAPIDAIRIRLKNLPASYKDGIMVVYKTIDQIKAIGLDAYQTAGSSPKKQTIILQNRVVKDGKPVGDQGPVTQEWNSLSASGQAISAISFGQKYIGGIAFITVLLGYMLVALLQGVGRRQEVRVKRIIGYSDRAIALQIAKIPLVATILILCGLVGSYLLLPTIGQLVFASLALLVGCLGAYGYVRIALGGKHKSRPKTSRVIINAFFLEVHRIVRQPLPFVLVVVGYIILALSVCVSTQVIINLSSLAGASRLSTRLSTMTSVFIIILLVIVFVISLVIVGIGSNRLYKSRQTELRVVNLLGMPKAVIVKARIYESIFLAIAAVIVTIFALCIVSTYFASPAILQYRFILICLVGTTALLVHFLSTRIGYV